MNWDYGTLPPCSTYEKEHQVAYPYVGANCNSLAQSDDIESDRHGPSKPEWGWAWDPAVPDTLPSCHMWDPAHRVPYPNVGANCVVRGHTSLVQKADIESDRHGPAKPAWGWAWDPAVPDSLPSCHKWRNAHEVAYPNVGANCVNREGKAALAQEPWDEESLGTCKDRRPAHVVAYPFVGANCRDTMSAVNGEKLEKGNSLVQKEACEPWDVDSLGSCKDRKPAHVVEYPFVGANCDPKKP